MKITIPAIGRDVAAGWPHHHRSALAGRLLVYQQVAGTPWRFAIGLLKPARALDDGKRVDSY